MKVFPVVTLFRNTHAPPKPTISVILNSKSLPVPAWPSAFCGERASEKTPRPAVALQLAPRTSHSRLIRHQAVRNYSIPAKRPSKNGHWKKRSLNLRESSSLHVLSRRRLDFPSTI